jgi:hypothetical protein
MAHRRVRQRGAAHRWPVVLQDPAVPLSAEIWPQIEVDGPAEGGTVGESQGTLEHEEMTQAFDALLDIPGL